MPPIAFVTVLILSGAFNSVCPQQPPSNSSVERDHGIELYDHGDTRAAIDELRKAVKQNGEDSKAWHYLGLALQSEKQSADARKAFERAVSIRIRELSGGPNSGGSADSGSTTATRFGAALESLQKYIELTANPTAAMVAELNELRFYHDYYSGARIDEEIVSTKEASTRVRIIKKPAPLFRNTRASGTSELRALFSSDGTVKHVLVLRQIDPAFDQACIDAAKEIQFVPATKDGRNVSVILLIEYNRVIY